MELIKLKNVIIGAFLIGLVVISPLAANAADHDDRKSGRDGRTVCSSIEVPSGNILVLRAFAIGVQVYKWNGTGWDLVAPIAKLFGDANYSEPLGTHFAGPTWMSNGGSAVIASKVEGCTPDPTAVAWLLLRMTATDGAGFFGNTTFIQRVNTAGGLPPSWPGQVIGSEVKVPYSAEYRFYRSEN